MTECLFTHYHNYFSFVQRHVQIIITIQPTIFPPGCCDKHDTSDQKRIVYFNVSPELFIVYAQFRKYWRSIEQLQLNPRAGYGISTIGNCYCRRNRVSARYGLGCVSSRCWVSEAYTGRYNNCFIALIVYKNSVIITLQYVI